RELVPFCPLPLPLPLPGSPAAASLEELRCVPRSPLDPERTMVMRRASLLVIASALSQAPILSLAADPGSDAYLGRWNLRIDGTGDTFSSSWLRIEKMGD